MTESFDTYLNTLLTEFSSNRPQNKYAEIAAHTPPEMIEAAREWISDCQWDNLDEDDIRELSPVEIISGVDKHYDGGWADFIRAEQQ